MPEIKRCFDEELASNCVPEPLREMRQWVCWRYIERDGRQTKCPINPVTGDPASSTDTSTWTSFGEALAAYLRDKQLSGIGFVFTLDDPFAGVDLDGCIKYGAIVPEAQAIIESLGSYTEFSPSGCGVKVFLNAFKPEGVGCRSDIVSEFDHVEIYDNKRFFVVTGRHVSDTPLTVEPRQQQLEDLCRELFPDATSSANGIRRLVPQGRAITIDMAGRESRCIAYLKRCPDAISGQGGHNSTLRAACECYRFGLDETSAWRVMRWFNDEKTGEEPWSEKEIAHKLESARRKVENRGETSVRLVTVPTDSSSISEKQIAALTTDVGNAARLVRRYGARIRYCFGPQQWLVWNGRRWKTDDCGRIVKYCKKTALSILNEAKKLRDEKQEKLLKWATQSQKRERLTAMAALAQPEVAVGPSELDADPWAFNCLSGTIDLRTGELRPHSQNDLITKLAPVEYQPDARCTRFDQFLQEIFDGNDQLITYVMRWHGYSLSGDVREQYLPIYFGQGNNGKNVLLDTISALMGDYAGEAPPDLLTVRKHPEHPTEIADLLGKRLVIASETELDAQLRLQFIKRLTGNARLKGRRMREDFFEFTRTHKLILVTNNRPSVREDSEAVWRRLRLVPFDVVIPPEKRDRELLAKLSVEWPGILASLVRACLDYFKEGLAEPEAVKFATKTFRGEANSIDGFVRDCCTIDPGITCVTAELREAYAEWCSRLRKVPLEGKAFAAALKERGCHPDKSRGKRIWVGISLDTSQIGREGRNGQ